MFDYAKRQIALRLMKWCGRIPSLFEAVSVDLPGWAAAFGNIGVKGCLWAKRKSD